MSEQRVNEIARIIDPSAFEPTSGFGHAEFAAEDREDRERAREKARQILATRPETYTRDQLEDEMLSEGPVEAMKPFLRPGVGDYLRNHHVRRALKAAFAAIDKGKGGEDG